MDTLFSPLPYATNPHLQTLLPRWVRRKITWQPFWQRLELADEDFVDLAWTEDPHTDTARHKPRIVILHGLEGSLHSPYAHGLLAEMAKQGWLGVVMHFRGCSGEPNRNYRLYHSGETSDIRYFLDWLPANLGMAHTTVVGYSLGGNVLGCYLGQEQQHAKLDAAVIVSAPFALAPSSYRLEQGLSKLYNLYLLDQLKQHAIRKLTRYPGTLPITAAEVKQLKTIRQFDNCITAPIHHFTDADHYYQQCSALPLLSSIAVPTLIIHAQDDPFMASEVILNPQQLPDCIEYQLTQFGGHVGFVSGTWTTPKMWLETRIPGWLKPLIESDL